MFQSMRMPPGYSNFFPGLCHLLPECSHCVHHDGQSLFQSKIFCLGKISTDIVRDTDISTLHSLQWLKHAFYELL